MIYPWGVLTARLDRGQRSRTPPGVALLIQRLEQRWISDTQTDDQLFFLIRDPKPGFCQIAIEHLVHFTPAEGTQNHIGEDVEEW
jgi:hypothetical protein